MANVKKREPRAPVKCAQCGGIPVTRCVPSWLCDECGSKCRSPNRKRSMVPVRELRRVCYLAAKTAPNDSLIKVDIERLRKFFLLGEFSSSDVDEQ